MFKRGTAPDDETCKHLCEGDQRDLDSNSVTREKSLIDLLFQNIPIYISSLFFLQPTPSSYTDKTDTNEYSSYVSTS